MKIRKIQKREFEGFKKQLASAAATSKEPKGKAVLGILEDMVWSDENDVVAALDGETCLGLMVVDGGNGHTAEIEQWVTTCGKKGVGGAMHQWLITAGNYSVVKLMPTPLSIGAYKKMGFEDAGNGYVQWVLPPPPPPD